MQTHDGNMNKSETKTAFSATKVVRHLRPRAKHVVGGLDGLDGFDGEASWPVWSCSAARHCWTMTKHNFLPFPSISGFFQVYCLHSALVHPFSCCLHSCPCSSRYISFFLVLLLFFYVFLMRTQGAYGLWHFHSGRVHSKIQMMDNLGHMPCICLEIQPRPNGYVMAYKPAIIPCHLQVPPDLCMP